MKKLHISKRIMALVLSLIMVVGLMPVMPMTANAATVAAKLPRYISEIAVAYGDTKSEAKSHLSGYTIIDYDLNKGCGGDYIYMGYKTTTDVEKALRRILFVYDDHDAYIGELLGSEIYNGSGQGVVNLNKGTGLFDDDIYAAVIGNGYGADPIGEIVINNSSSMPGYTTAEYLNEDHDWVPADLNYGAGGEYIYLHYKAPDLETTTLHYIDADISHKTVVPKLTCNCIYNVYGLNFDSSTLPSPIIYKNVEYDFVSWVDPEAHAAWGYELGMWRDELSDFYARYSGDVILTFDSNDGNGAPSPIMGETYLIAYDPIVEGKASITIPDETFSHNTKGAFLGWSEDKNATAATYLPGGSIEISKNTTLYAVFAEHEHNLTYSLDGDDTIKEECTAQNCNHSATAALVQDTSIPTVYTGSAIEALKVNYSDNWQGGQLDIVYSNNTNAGTASGSISVDGATATKTFEITKADMSGLQVSLSEETFIYNGLSQKPMATVTFNGTTLTENADYELWYISSDEVSKWENGEPVKFFGNTQAECINAGQYYAVVNGKGNYFGTKSKAFTINKAAVTVTADAKSKAYGEGDPALTWSITKGALVNGEQLTGITISRVSGENANTYAITVSQAEGVNKNYYITFVGGTFTINAKTVDAIVTVNGAPFFYNGSEQKPEIVVKGGNTVIPANEYEISYSNNTNAGTATVIVTDKTGGNYVVNGSATFIINKADPVIGTVGVDGIVKDSTKPSEVNLTRTDITVDGVLNLADGAMLANKSIYRWVFTPADTDNYNVINGDVQIDVLDTVLPTAVIKVDTNDWKQFISNITFGLFFKDTQEVTITAADNENGSGIKDILYVVSERELDENELATVEWKTYTEAFDIEPDGKFIIYAKITDNDGNIVIINSDGVVVDETAAVVNGITDGETYYGQLVFTVADELAGVKSVIIDGNDETHFDGQYVINGDNAEHTVTVTDNAGNVTEYKVTVYKNHTVTDPDSPQTGDNSNIALWIALLFISGGAVITLTVVDRKSRYTAKH